MEAYRKGAGHARNCTRRRRKGQRATRANIQGAFDRWIRMARLNPRNGAVFYYSGHGARKVNCFLLPEDAVLPSGSEQPRNLIDVDQTVVNLLQFKPELQCFFIDACQDTVPALLSNVSANPGSPLALPTNGARALRDAWLFYGSQTGRAAYGPQDGPPFFTQELIECLKRRAAEPNKLGDVWEVTTASLKKVLKPAGAMRSLAENQPISFSAHSPAPTDLIGQICQFQASPEIFIEVRCRPIDALSQARLFVTDATKIKQQRTPPQPTSWYTKVPLGTCQAGAEFTSSDEYTCSEQSFTPTPPFAPFELSVQPNLAKRPGERDR